MSVLVLSEFENQGEQLLDEQDDAVFETVAETRLSDERANVPVSLVVERFLRAIVDKVPLDRIEELHLFSPLRQGTVETGIAVVAARVIVLEEVTVPQPLELQLDGDLNAAGAMSDVGAVAHLEAADVVTEIPEDERAVDVQNSGESERQRVKSDERELIISAADRIRHHAAHDDSPYADEPVQLTLLRPSEYPEGESDTVSAVVREPELIAAQSPEPRVRHTVYTARYRLIIKGPERGKWEIGVVDEADAPLLAVETVVRGVQRRAGEQTATVRYDASQLARILRLPLPE